MKIALNTPSENSKKQSDNAKTPQTILITQRRRSWNNNSHSTGVVKPVNGILTIPLNAILSFVIKRTLIYKIYKQSSL